MKYGGDLANELKKVCVTYKEEEYVSISKSYLNEIMSHRDEYQTMFEEYFQVSGEFTFYGFPLKEMSVFFNSTKPSN